MVKNFVFKSCFILLCGFLMNSCKKDKKTAIEMDYPFFVYYNMEIDVTRVDTFIERESFEISTTLEGEMSNKNSTKKNIRSAKLAFLRIQVLDYALDTNKYGNLRDLSAMELDIKKEGFGQELVASKLIPDVYTKAVNLDLRDVELREYMKQDVIKLVIRYKKRREMPNEMPFVITGKYIIVADPL
jgi:hypothetical protein